MGRGITQISKEIKYLTSDEIIKIHDTVLKQFGGGAEGIFAGGYDGINGIIQRMKEGYFGHQPFDTLIRKNSFMFQSLLIYHPFIDGLKRTGFVSSLAFLLRNGYILISKNVQESVDFVVMVADEMKEKDSEESLNHISDWFRERIISINDKDTLFNYVKSQKPRFKCPRCANNRMTWDDPFCHDCGNQQLGFYFTINAIVENLVIKYSREPSPLPIKMIKRSQLFPR